MGMNLIGSNLWRENKLQTPNNTYWTTKDGRRLLVANMADDHVANCVKLMTRKLGGSSRYSCSDKVRLCQLIIEAQSYVILAALTDPNQ